jgi:hypothetical protein
MPAAVERTTFRGNQVAVIARQRPAGGLDRCSLGLDLPPDLVLPMDGELTISARVCLGPDGRPWLLQADIRCGEERWSSPRTPADAA